MPYKDPVKRKEKQRGYAKKHYENNSGKVKNRVGKKNKILREEWLKFKATLSCLECGMNHPGVLDFHHIDPEMKTGSVHKYVNNRSWKKVFEEVEQCLVLCANCHRMFHYNERKQKKQAKKDKKNGAEAP